MKLLFFLYTEGISRRQMRFEDVFDVGCDRYLHCRLLRAVRKDLSHGKEFGEEDTQFDFIKRYPLASFVMCKRVRFLLTASSVKHSTGVYRCAHDALTSWSERLTSPFDSYGGCMWKDLLVRYFTCLSLPTMVCVELWCCDFSFGTDSWVFWE